MQLLQAFWSNTNSNQGLPMTTDFRAMCAELCEELNGLSAHIEGSTPFETVLSSLRAYNRARAALARWGK